MSKAKEIYLVAALLFVFNSTGFAQSGRQVPTPTPDAVEKVATEEIKLNILALNQYDEFVADVKAEDLVISEDGRLHQATSARRIPANVLLVLDVGNEISYAKRNRATAETARGLVGALRETDAVAVMQYGDKVEILSDWTRSRVQLAQILNERKLGFGKRSLFVEAMNKAIEFFDRTPLENRHLILISDGIDTYNNKTEIDRVTRKLLSSDINVHVISYTKLQQDAVQKALKQKSAPPRINLPPGASPPHSETTRRSTISTINLDREMINKRRDDLRKLKESETYLATIAEDTNGEIFLPDSTEEMAEKTALLAKTIDSQYVVNYTPKRPLDEAENGEVRLIEVTSRRPGLIVQGKRKFIVTNKN